MFLGHFALGLAAKRIAPRTSLVFLLGAPILLDLLWPIFLVAGLEQVALAAAPPTVFLRLDFTHYPWSHSLAMSVVWSALLALAYALATRERSVALLLAALVLSHWLLDLVTHVPDLPLAPGGAARVGLGLWRSAAATIVIEAAMLAAGIALYLGSTRANGLLGHLSFWSLASFLVVAYAASLAGPPPPSVNALKWVALASWLFVPWAFWVERTRRAA